MKHLFVHSVGMKIISRIFILALIGCAALGTTLFSTNHQAHATLFSTNHQAHAALCGDNSPCVSAGASNGSIVVTWFYEGGDPNASLPDNVDYYQLRWSANSGAQTQVQINVGNNLSDGSYTLNNVNPDDYYGFIVQACQTHFLAPSSCTAWSDISYYAPYGLETCLNGYVWRQAYSGDDVCVTPATRDQAAYDNSQASNRIDPNGAYGPDSCISGYVWREASKGVDYVYLDHVCVTPATRDQAAYDNSQASSRKLYP